MAFVNEKLSADQRADFINRNIMYTLNGYDYRQLQPLHWTCDKERNMYLFFACTPCRDCPDERAFFFECDFGYFIVSLRLKRERLSDDKIRIKWDNFKILYANSECFDIEALKRGIIEALRAYDLLGMPELKLKCEKVDFVFEL